MNKEKIDKVVAKLCGRTSSFFEEDIEQSSEILFERLENKSVLVIGGAGTIGFHFIKAILNYPIKRLFVVDINENGLAEVIRDLRSASYDVLPEIKTYPLSFGSKVFEKLFINEGPFEIVANFAALKHVRSEKDEYAIEAMFDTNFVMANQLLSLLSSHKPERFFCVSTDKATNPVSIMGATKKLMEEVIFSYKNQFNISTARFANVAFSNGSLLESFIYRYNKNQPIVCPGDVKRYFVSPSEAGELCMLACILGNSGEIFIPKLDAAKDLSPFTVALDSFLQELKLTPKHFESDEEARLFCLEKSAEELQDNYPVFIFPTDTSGEKLYEEFYSEEDSVDWDRMESIAQVTTYINQENNGEEIVEESKKLFETQITKSDVVSFLEKHIPEFKHIEKGKNLDQKM